MGLIMKNKKLLKIGLFSGLSVLFLIVGSLFAAGADKTVLNDGVYFSNIAFAFLFFMFFAITISFTIFYIVGSINKSKKYSDEVKIDEVEKIEPKISQ